MAIRGGYDASEAPRVAAQMIAERPLIECLAACDAHCFEAKRTDDYETAGFWCAVRGHCEQLARIDVAAIGQPADAARAEAKVAEPVTEPIRRDLDSYQCRECGSVEINEHCMARFDANSGRYCEQGDDPSNYVCGECGSEDIAKPGDAFGCENCGRNDGGALYVSLCEGRPDGSMAMLCQPCAIDARNAGYVARFIEVASA